MAMSLSTESQRVSVRSQTIPDLYQEDSRAAQVLVSCLFHLQQRILRGFQSLDEGFGTTSIGDQGVGGGILHAGTDMVALQF
jgi:hypothetical protein